MRNEMGRGPSRWTSRATALRLVLLSLVVVALAVPAAGYSGESTATQTG
jgi:hypothetical protein